MERDKIESMGNAQPKYVISADGRKRGVMLEMAHYRRLLQRIEDLQDALTLDRAEQTSEKLIPYSEVRARLKRAGKL